MQSINRCELRLGVWGGGGEYSHSAEQSLMEDSTHPTGRGLTWLINIHEMFGWAHDL